MSRVCDDNSLEGDWGSGSFSAPGSLRHVAGGSMRGVGAGGEDADGGGMGGDLRDVGGGDREKRADRVPCEDVF